MYDESSRVLDSTGNRSRVKKYARNVSRLSRIISPQRVNLSENKTPVCRRHVAAGLPERRRPLALSDRCLRDGRALSEKFVRHSDSTIFWETSDANPGSTCGENRDRERESRDKFASVADEDGTRCSLTRKISVRELCTGS